MEKAFLLIFTDCLTDGTLVHDLTVVVKDMNVDVPDTLVQFRPFSNAKNEMQTRSRVGFSDVTVVENYPLNKVKSLEVLKIGRREYFHS